MEQNTRLLSTYSHGLDSIAELIVAGKDEFRGKLPLPGLLTLLEVGLQLEAVLLVSLFEGFENITGFPDFVNSFFHLSFEDFRWLKEVGGLKQNVEGLCFKIHAYMSRVMRKPVFCICKNKDADQLRSNREADQRLCFRHRDSAISLLSKSEISSL